MTTESKILNWDQFVLPVSLASKSDVTRLIRELEGLSNELVSDNVKQSAGFMIENKYVISQQMQDFTDANSLNLSERDQRDHVLKQLQILKNQAPMVHVTLASRVRNSELADLVQWFRREIHQQAVLIIGLQPGLIGGVHIRTPNHVYDFSVKSQLEGHHDIIEKALETLSGRV